MQKKGQLGGLSTDILALVIAGVFLVFGIIMMSSLRDTRIDGSAGCNSTDLNKCKEVFMAGNDTVSGLTAFADFWEIIVLAIVIGVVVAILLTRFGRTRR